MIVEFACPYCGSLCRGLDEHAGKKARCTECQHLVVIPGAPPIKSEIAATRSVIQEDEDTELDDLADEESEGDTEERDRGDFERFPDVSDGVASLYLAAFSFFLFFTPALLSSMLGALGASIAFFAGVFTSTGCFLLCRRGLQLGERAARGEHGRGYAEAGQLVNRFLWWFYVLAMAFFLIGGIFLVFAAKNAVGIPGLPQLPLKGLEQLKDLDKLMRP